MAIMFQSAIIRLCVLSVSVAIITADERQNCGRHFPPCPAGQVCLPPGKQGVNGVKGQSKCYISCGPIPNFGPHVEVCNIIGDNVVGTSVPYTCVPCTYFVDINVKSSTITCQADGTWSTPTCVSAADVGHLVDGTPVPAGALGCWTTTCGSSVPGGFRMNGVTTKCYCDSPCCGYGDCCYDFSCIF